MPRLSRPNFGMTRLSRLISSLSRATNFWYNWTFSTNGGSPVQTFQAQTLDATMQFGCKSCPDIPGSNFWREYAIWVRFLPPNPDFGNKILVRPDFRDPFPVFCDQILLCLDFFDQRRDSFRDFPGSNFRRDYAIRV